MKEKINIVDIIKIIILWATSIIIFVFISLLNLLFYPIHLLLKGMKIVKPYQEKTYPNYRSFINSEYENDCIECARKEHDKFETYWIYDEFEKWLKYSNISLWGIVSGKIGKHEYNYGFIQYGKSSFFYGAHLYKCNVCNSMWELSEPDNAWRGYFKRIELKSNIPESMIKRL